MSSRDRRVLAKLPPMQARFILTQGVYLRERRFNLLFHKAETFGTVLHQQLQHALAYTQDRAVPVSLHIPVYKINNCCCRVSVPLVGSLHA